MIRRLDDEFSPPPPPGGAPGGWSGGAPGEAGARPDACDSILARRAKLVLDVVPGERRLLPEFGCRIHLLPSLATEGDRGIAAALVEEALARWVPGLGVERAEVTEAEEGRINLLLDAGGISHRLAITHRYRARRRRDMALGAQPGALGAQPGPPGAQPGSAPGAQPGSAPGAEPGRARGGAQKTSAPGAPPTSAPGAAAKEAP